MGNTDVRLEPSTVEEKGCIKNLYQYYLHDLSEFADTLQPDSDGLFDQSFVDDYYCEDQFIPLKISLHNQIVGFMFCSTGQTVDYVIQDIFVLRNYRNKGFARLALKQFFILCNGKIGFVVLKKNQPANLFWKHCLESFGIHYTTCEVTEHGELCLKYILDCEKPLHSNMQR